MYTLIVGKKTFFSFSLEILEEHQVEIETIKSDYEEETEQLRVRF